MTPQEELDDELRRYWLFEGGVGELFDPLGWWKVRSHAIHSSHAFSPV
jgi:hypothetical protein